MNIHLPVRIEVRIWCLYYTGDNIVYIYRSVFDTYLPALNTSVDNSNQAEDSNEVEPPP